MSEWIGFIGLGMMGRGMAHNLLRAGFVLTVWNRTASRMDDLVAAGATAAASPAEVLGLPGAVRAPVGAVGRPELAHVDVQPLLLGGGRERVVGRRHAGELAPVDPRIGQRLVRLDRTGNGDERDERGEGDKDDRGLPALERVATGPARRREEARLDSGRTGSRGWLGHPR